MNADELLLIFSFLICWTTLVFLIIKAKNRKQIILINLIVHFIYSSYFLYGLFYDSKGNGTALAWWFFLLLFLLIHSIINLGQLVYLYLKTKTKSRREGFVGEDANN